MDLDGDGDFDAVVGNYWGTRLQYFENTGTSSNPGFVQVTGAANPFYHIDVGSRLGYRSSPELVDLDGDGDLDTVVGNSPGTLLYFENTGSSTSPSFIEASGAANPFSGIDVASNGTPELVDLDGDGDLDAVVGESSGSLLYFENTGASNSPAFVETTGAANPLFDIDVGHNSSPELVDLDGDGDLDAVIGGGYGSLLFFDNTGSSNSPDFVEATGAANPFSGIDVGDWSSPDLVDLDGDSDLDAVVGEYDGRLLYFKNTGGTSSPAFVEASGAANPFSGIDVGRRSSPDLGDLDGDDEPRCGRRRVVRRAAVLREHRKLQQPRLRRGVRCRESVLRHRRRQQVHARAGRSGRRRRPRCGRRKLGRELAVL